MSPTSVWPHAATKPLQQGSLSEQVCSCKGPGCCFAKRITEDSTPHCLAMSTHVLMFSLDISLQPTVLDAVILGV